MKLHHFCIQTNCYEESLRFYMDVLGMTLLEETKGFHNRAYNTWLKGSDFMIELQTPKDGESFEKITSNHSGVNHICFYIEDIEAEYQRLVDCGVKNYATASNAAADSSTASFQMKHGSVIYQVNNTKLFKLTAPEGTIWEFRNNIEY